MFCGDLFHKGEPVEEMECNTDLTCPPECEFGPDWAPWQPCTVTCGGGSRLREKKCECKNSDKCDGCEGKVIYINQIKFVDQNQISRL